MNQQTTAINQLRDGIKQVYLTTRAQLNASIHRGHSRSISADIEDHIALFIFNVIKEGYQIYLDPSVIVNNKTIRPDMLIVNDSLEVVALIEIKANMGYCRDATDVLNKLKQTHNDFINAYQLECKFSNQLTLTKHIIYKNDVKVFLISLTEDNCSLDNHNNNRINAQSLDIKYYNLFTNWYDQLVDKDVVYFHDELVKL